MLVVPKKEQQTPELEAASETNSEQLQGTESNSIFRTRLEQSVLCPLNSLTALASCYLKHCLAKVRSECYERK